MFSGQKCNPSSDSVSEINYLLYALDTDFKSKGADLTLAFNGFSINAGNAVILYSFVKDKSCLEVRKYKACIIQHGNWVLGEDNTMIEVFMGKLILENKGLLTPENTKNYAELINQVLINANITHRAMIKDRNIPETKQVNEQKRQLTETALFELICCLAEKQEEAELTKVIEEYICVDVFQNDYTPCGYLAFKNNTLAVNFLIDNFDANLNDAVYGAAVGGHENLVNALIEKGASIDQAVAGAVKSRNTSLVEKLIARGASKDFVIYGAIEEKDVSLNQLVTIAAQKGNVRLVNELIARGASKDAAVKAAARRGHKQLVEDLIDRGASFNEAIYGAKEGGHEKLIIYLINKVYHGKCPNDFSPCAKLAFQNNQDAVNCLIDDFNYLNDAIYGAAAGKHQDFVDDLLAKGASLHQAVSGAARSGNKYLVEYLIARGASLNFALYGASTGCHFKLIKNLRLRGASIDYGVAGAVEAGNIELVHDFIAKGASKDVAAKRAAKTGQSELLLKCLIAEGACLSEVVFGAALRGDVALVNDLIAKGAGKDSALEGAARGGHKQLVKSLLVEGADVRWAAFGFAARGREKLVANLLDHARHNFSQILSWALRGAAEEGNINLVKKLIARGAHINSFDRRLLIDNTLIGAAKRGHIKLVNYCIAQGNLDLNLDNAIEIAAENGHQKLAEYLFKKAKSQMEKHLCRYAALRGADRSKNIKYVEKLVDSEGVVERMNAPAFITPLKQAVCGAFPYLQDEKNTLFILSECQHEKFRKQFLLEAKEQKKLLRFEHTDDDLLLKAKKISSYKQEANLSFNESLACIQPEIYGLFSFISQTAHENYLNMPCWSIIAAYLFPLEEIEVKKIRFAIKRENVIHDVNAYYHSLGKLSYFSKTATKKLATKARELIEECKKAKSEKSLDKTIEETDDQENETLYKVISKYQKK